MTSLWIVPAERHVERLARDGQRAETRSSLRSRLAAALLPDVRFADPREVRLTLGMAIEAGRGAQLDLFGGGTAVIDPLLAQLQGPSWVRAVEAIDDAIGALRTRGVTEAQLDRAARGPGVAGARARTLVFAMRALDAALAPARDGRLLGDALAKAITAVGAAKVADAVGSRQVAARWILSWEASDLAWWRALGDVLPGGVRVVLPWFDKKLEGGRERDPLEIVADQVMKGLEAAPETEMIPPVLGDLAATPPTAVPTVSIGKATDGAEQARLVAAVVEDALRTGARIERIAIAYPTREERTLRPLRRALGERGIVFHDALGPPPAAVPVVAAAFSALAAADSKERVAVARLLSSGYVDAPRALGSDMSFRDAERVLDRIARALETRATAAGEDAARRLAATAGGDEHAARIVEVLGVGDGARTRLERVRAARRLFTELGIAARAGRGALATFARDEAPSGVDRAERLAVARDVRAWELLEEGLDVYEAAALRAGGQSPVDPEVFLLELGSLVDGGGSVPGAGRAGAVRIARLADIAGDELDLLVVLDANNGVLPRDQRPVSLVTESLEERVKLPRDAGLDAARDLAALAVAAAEAARVVLVTTAEDAGDAPAAPARVVVAVERAGASVVRAPSETRSAVDVARRAARERAREAFFLDPRRPASDIAGTLAAGPLLARVVTPETGGVQDRPLAVTSIERFAQCPFKGYAHVVLGARQAEEQRELPDAREEGNLGHEALAAAFVATRVEWALRPRDADRILARGLAAADASLAKASGHAPLRAIVRLRIRESVRAVLLRALDDDQWDFSLAEQPFGREKPWPALAVGGALWLRGSVDRIDRAHDGSAVRVIDYKRSKSTVASSMASLGESAIQVPLYAAVAARNLSLPATGAYLPTQPRDLATSTTARPKEDRVAELARGNPSEIERRVLALAAGAREGRFPPIPTRESECTYCVVSGGCRKPRFAMERIDDDDLEALEKGRE